MVNQKAQSKVMLNYYYRDDKNKKSKNKEKSCVEECPGNKLKKEASKKAGDKKGINCDEGCPGKANGKNGQQQKPASDSTKTKCAANKCGGIKGPVTDDEACKDSPGFGSGSVLLRDDTGVAKVAECPNTCSGKTNRIGLGPRTICPDTCTKAKGATQETKAEEKPAEPAPADEAPAEAPPEENPLPEAEAVVEPLVTEEPAPEAPAAEAPAEEAPAAEAPAEG